MYFLTPDSNNPAEKRVTKETKLKLYMKDSKCYKSLTSKSRKTVEREATTKLDFEGRGSLTEWLSYKVVEVTQRITNFENRLDPKISVPLY